MLDGCIGVLGARSFVGESLLSLVSNQGQCVTAFSRRQMNVSDPGFRGEWFCLADEANGRDGFDKNIFNWISVAPIWVLPDYFPMLERGGIRRIVALSSTSCFTKAGSSDAKEQALSQRLKSAEEQLMDWAETLGIEFIILRPTLIYGGGKDKNIVEIARFIERFGFFPVFGEAKGLRQPIHAADVAMACLQALNTSSVAGQIYNISGGETLSYADMVGRVFEGLSRRKRIISIPLSVFRLVGMSLNVFSVLRGWSLAMVERMNSDLVFDHSDAVRDFGFSPRLFVLSSTDLPDGVDKVT